GSCAVLTCRSTRAGCEYVLGRFVPGRSGDPAVLLQTHLPPPRVVGAPASGANMRLPRPHRGRCSYQHTCHHPVSWEHPPRVRLCACPVRTGGGAPTNTPAATSYRRGTRPGCEYVPDRFAPGAVRLQMNLPPPRIVGAPASGANVCLTGSHRGGAPTATLPAPRIVGAPAPGANELFPCDGLR